MKLPLLIKRPVQFLLEPYSLAGPGRALPLMFWQSFAAWKGLAAETSFLENQEPLDFDAYSANTFRNHLLENLLPFWASHSIDRDHGGFITHLDRHGQVYDPASRRTAMQARLVYAFSVGHALSPDRGYLALARHGVDFMSEKCWDSQHAGWYESIHPDGQVQLSSKTGFNQAYALVGLLEYYRMSRDAVVLEWISQAYEKLEQIAWHAPASGYLESFHSDWTIELNRKTICVQLDMLRAVLGLWSVTGEARFHQRAVQLGDLVVDHMCDPEFGCALEVFHPDWRYAPARFQDQVWIGHNLKAAWLLLSLDRLAPNPRYVQAATRMVEYCLRYAWDSQHGGFYQYIYRTGRLASPIKLWWPQTEGLNALLLLHQKTGEPRYSEAFQRLAKFCFTHFVDHDYGEWYTSCRADGLPIDDHKGGNIKSAYHTVQTCVIAAQGLDSLLGITV